MKSLYKNFKKMVKKATKNDFFVAFIDYLYYSTFSSAEEELIEIKFEESSS